MAVCGFDHVAIPAEKVEELLAFYKRLGFALTGEAEWRAGTGRFFSIQFGANKIHLPPPAPWLSRSFQLRRPPASPGSGLF